MSCDGELSLSIHHFYFLWAFFYLGENQFCCKAALGFHSFQWCFWITARVSYHLPEQWFFPCMLYCLYWGNLWSQSLRCRWEWETSCPCSNLRLNLDWLEGTHIHKEIKPDQGSDSFLLIWSLMLSWDAHLSPHFGLTCTSCHVKQTQSMQRSSFGTCGSAPPMGGKRNPEKQVSVLNFFLYRSLHLRWK